MKPQKLTPQQVGTYLLGIVTFCVTQVVAFVPTLGNDKQILISAGGALVSAGVAVAGAVHDLAGAHRTASAITLNYPAQAAPAQAAKAQSPEDILRQQLQAAGIEAAA